jgi:glycosyltransferase involved in cell wall biosynthesis
MLRYTPDILFVPSHTIPLIHPKNTITTIHDIGFICAPWLYSFKERWRQRFSLYLTLKGAKKIIIPSEFTKQELTQSFRLKPERLTVIPHGVDCSRFKTNHDKEKIKFLLEKYHLEKPYIFFIGRLEKKKNVHKILQAWTILKATHPDLTKNYQLVLAGRPSFKFRYLLTRSSNQQILTLGFIPDNDVPYLMEGASLFLFPSLYEGFGMPLLEAMASGVPVIAASGASIPEVVKEAAKLVDPHDPRNLAQGIYEILSDDSYRQSLILKGLERVKDFSWEKCAKQTLDVLLMA